MGLVAPVEGPSAWRGQDIANSKRWICDLQPRHIGEIEAALAMVEKRAIDWREITATDFPLPGLTDLIGQIRNELEHGCGLMKLRGRLCKVSFIMADFSLFAQESCLF